VQQFSEVKIKIGGHSTRTWSKVPYKLKIDKESSPDGLFGRYHLKLRSEATDPTIVREKLYADMLESTGVVSSQGAYVRLFLNDQPVGIFLLVDDVTSKQ
jgi:spore coat protein CotH